MGQLHQEAAGRYCEGVWAVRNVLSLFNGIGCGRVALQRAGIEHGVFYSSEVDKYAIQINDKNHPDTVQLGDVTKWREWDIDWSSIDLIMAGSPCQGFSMAGKGLAFNDPRSALFFEFVHILNHVRAVNPDVKFLLENVKMKKDYLDIITSILGVEPVLINSALVSAQNRQRYYWANWEFGQPEDKGIMLEDIIEVNPKDIVYLSETTVRRFLGYGVKLMDGTEDKAKCLSAMEYVKNGKQGNYIIVHNLYGGFKEKVCRVFQDKAPTLRTSAGGGHIPSVFCVLKEVAQAIPLEWLRKLVRKLTPIECERLQTLDDGYTEGVSNTQRYKALGNGWTVDVIVHILKNIGEEK